MNYSILQTNVINSLQSEDAIKAFLWACDKPDDPRHYKAEEYAREVDALVEKLRPMLRMTSDVHGFETAPDGLERFILDRHKNLRYPRGAH